MRGFISEIFRLFVWVGTLFSTYYAYTHYPNFLPKFHPVVMAVILFVVFLIIFKLIHLIVDQLFRKDSFSFINKPLGLLYGLLRGVSLILAASYPLKSFHFESRVIDFVEKNIKNDPRIQEYEGILNKQFTALLAPLEKEISQKNTVPSQLQ